METGTAPPGNALPQLTKPQLRVLGCLIEKEATTPDAYPLTVNAAHVAANQKTAREPVMALDPGDVQHALRQLEQLDLAKQSFSSRADRYAHRVDETLALPRQQTVLLGLLLLRGAQTQRELLARSERMAQFEGVEDVHHHLERMARRTPALVVLLPRGSGQREDRYMHLLGGPVQAATQAPDAKIHDGTGTASLRERVEALEAEVAALHARLEALRG